MTEFTLQARIELISNVSVEKKAWSRPPIQMEFQVPMFAASGLQIRYLRVIERSGYNAVKVNTPHRSLFVAVTNIDLVVGAILD